MSGELITAQDAPQENPRALAEDKVKKLSSKHFQIMEYMVLNPQTKLGEVAKHFDITQSWLSSLINSDMFKEEFTRRLETQRARNDLHVQEKFGKVVSKAADKMVDHLDSEDCDPKTVNEYANTALAALGYGPKGGGRNGSDEPKALGMRLQVGDNTWAEAQAIIRGIS